MSSRSVGLVVVASLLTACGSQHPASGKRPLTLLDVRTAFAAHRLYVGRDDTTPALRSADRRKHIVASLLATGRTRSSPVAEVTIFESASRARHAPRRTEGVPPCRANCGTAGVEPFVPARVRVRNVIVDPEPVYGGSAGQDADLRRLVLAIHALRTR